MEPERCVSTKKPPSGWGMSPSLGMRSDVLWGRGMMNLDDVLWMMEDEWLDDGLDDG